MGKTFKRRRAPPPSPTYLLLKVLLAALWRDDSKADCAPPAVVASAFQRWFADAYGYLADPQASYAVAQEAPLVWLAARCWLWLDRWLPWAVRARSALMRTRGATLGNVIAVDGWVRSAFDESAASQVLLLSPGLGTRALRQTTSRCAESRLGTAVYEVDHPRVLARKAMLLTSLGLPGGAVAKKVAPHLINDAHAPPVVVPFDLTHRPRRLRSELESRGFDVRRRTLAIWEEGLTACGVPALDAVLNLVAQCAPGSAALLALNDTERHRSLSAVLTVVPEGRFTVQHWAREIAPGLLVGEHLDAPDLARGALRFVGGWPWWLPPLRAGPTFQLLRLYVPDRPVEVFMQGPANQIRVRIPGPMSAKAEAIRLAAVAERLQRHAQPPPPPPRVAMCVMCGKPTQPFFDCESCRSVGYCSKGCQKSNRWAHAKECDTFWRITSRQFEFPRKDFANGNIHPASVHRIARADHPF